ncbi:DUF6005 family protein [Paenibacillus soyae]|uniref:DUF6005 family protein n=1 Tax=Paenibacillus soyae TaxID=2969249 RepID=A0A9X2SCU3_9BACL|nr:DUF6005 family protein [Paenibacillus soyae]MCR2807143.1 DUF6005 family protein [Paenibacillus soyae]
MAIKEEVSIKVHCIVSCLCEVLRERSGIDYRPFYMGLWDAPFDVTESGEVTYYQHDLDHSHYYEWFEDLFGAKVTEWYDKDLPAENNLATMLRLIEECPPDRYVMAQIDMSFLPERDNKFHQKPFPHFLMLAHTEDPEEWAMIDPDFRWRGTVPRARAVEAFVGNPFGGGFYVDSSRLREASREDVKHYFHTVFHWENGLTEKLKELIRAMASGENGFSIGMIAGAVKQLPVLAIRKYSYEHALMYFIDETGSGGDTFEAYADLVEELVRGFHNVQYLGMKMAMTGSAKLLEQTLAKLEEMDALERRIKCEVYRLYGLWEAMR